MVVSASNRLPEDDALGALFDRFLLRVRCDNVAPERLSDVLEAGWKLDLPRPEAAAVLDIEDIRRLNRMLADVDLGAVRTAYVELVHRLRHAGIPISDHRAGQVAAAAGGRRTVVRKARGQCHRPVGAALYLGYGRAAGGAGLDRAGRHRSERRPARGELIPARKAAMPPIRNAWPGICSISPSGRPAAICRPRRKPT